MVVDDPGLAIRAGLDGIGLVFVDEAEVLDYLKSGRLVRVLQGWCKPYPGFFMYYPGRRQQAAAFAAVIRVFRA